MVIICWSVYQTLFMGICCSGLAGAARVTALRGEARARWTTGPLPQLLLPENRWQAARCSGQLGAKAKTTEQEVAAFRLAHLAGWVRSRSRYENFLRENSFLECYSSIRQALSDDLW